MKRQVERVVIVGTGTEIGKTHVTCALLKAAALHGWPSIGLKPVETGTSEGGFRSGEDGACLWASSNASVFHVKRAAPYRFRPPISPHLAAREAGVRIDVAAIRDYVDGVEGEGFRIIETAGGLGSPLAPGLTNLDIVRALAPCRVVMVASDRLGVLHDLTVTLAFAKAGGQPPDVVVLSAPAESDASTGTNAEELEALAITEITGVFPRSAAGSSESIAVAERVWARLLESSPYCPEPLVESKEGGEGPEETGGARKR